MIAKQEILARFSKVYKSGDDEYQCLCPSHDDRNASLGLKFKEDKMILNCFAGCSMQDILDAIGLSWGDVMPDSKPNEYKHEKMRFNPYAVIKASKQDILFIAVCSAHVAAGNALEKNDREKLFQITERLRELYDNIK
tara:strand:- start:1064 stop:1477 length:414 start_codon:yes stop_codon:yes gene_type:complete